MFENFKKINIKGGYFDEETELRLFNEDSLSILYGRNGSGKSTIARCLWKKSFKLALCAHSNWPYRVAAHFFIQNLFNIFVSGLLLMPLFIIFSLQK